MVYVTGDMHGDFSRFSAPAARRLRKGDTLLVCGDFGFLWDGSKKEERILKKIAKRRYTVAFLDGKYENFSLLEAYPVCEWNGGKAQDIGGVFHLLRGEIYTIENARYFVFGGAQSEEDAAMPTGEEMTRGLANLAACGNEVAYILTHEPSGKASGYFAHRRNRLGGIHVYLNQMEQQVAFQKWFFGCLHLDKVISSRHRALFRDIVPVDGK